MAQAPIKPRRGRGPGGVVSIGKTQNGNGGGVGGENPLGSYEER